MQIWVNFDLSGPVSQLLLLSLLVGVERGVSRKHWLSLLLL